LLLFLTCYHIDIVPSPEKIPNRFSQSRKEYLEDEAIEGYKKSEESNEEMLRESEEIIEHDNSQMQKFPILFVDVNLGEDRVERLTVYEGDQAKDVAHEF